jgi:cytoskeletal protein CcmA (bactofilin family)
MVHSRLLGILFGIVIGLWVIVDAPDLDAADAAFSPNKTCLMHGAAFESNLERDIWSTICHGEIYRFRSNKTWKAPHSPPTPCSDCDDAKPQCHESHRVLRPNFIRTILQYDPWRSAIPPDGVRIEGAWFKDKFSLSQMRLKSVLWLDDSCFSEEVDLLGIKTSRDLSFEGSVFKKILQMRWAQIDGQLNLNGITAMRGLNLVGLKAKSYVLMKRTCLKAPIEKEAEEKNKIVFREARIQGQLELSNSCVIGELDMNGLQVSSTLFLGESLISSDVNLRSARVNRLIDLRKTHIRGRMDMNALKAGALSTQGAAGYFKEIDLRGARLDDEMNLSGSTVEQTLNMSGLKVNGLLKMDGGSFNEIDLRGAEIDRQFILSHSEVTNQLKMNGFKVAGDLLIRGSTLKQEVDLRGGKIGGTLSLFKTHVYKGFNMAYAQVANLELFGATLRGFDLTGTRITEELRLSNGDHEHTKWLYHSSKLILHNANVGAIQDTPDVWPLFLDLEGFAYAKLGSLNPKGSSRQNEWLHTWLSRHQPYSPQPYEYLAKILRQGGHKRLAKEILYTSKERDLKTSCYNENTDTKDSIKIRKFDFYCISLELQKYFIGYGQRLYYALFWTLGVIGYGMFVLSIYGETKKWKMKYWGLAYSLDMILPIIELQKYHTDVIQLEGFPKLYFYCQKIFGYILALYLVAGITEPLNLNNSP